MALRKGSVPTDRQAKNTHLSSKLDKCVELLHFLERFIAVWVKFALREEN